MSLEEDVKPKPELWRAAIHEAGHIVADYLHCFFPVKVTIAEEGNGRTNCRDDRPCKETAALYAISCLAGPSAEKVLVGENSTSAAGAAGDNARAENALSLVQDITLSQCRCAAERLVSIDSNQSAIRRIATDLAERKALDGEELLLLVEAALGEADAELKLAKLRAGPDRPKLGMLTCLDIPANPSELGPKAALLRGDFVCLADGDVVVASGRTDEDFTRSAAFCGAKRDVYLEVFGNADADGPFLVTVELFDRKIRLTPFPIPDRP